MRLRQTTGGEDRAIHIYDTLLRLTLQGEAVPHIAKSLESDDGMLWTMKLTEGVMFSDGTPLDAEAVKFNMETHLDPETGSTSRRVMGAIESVTVIDPLTVEFQLNTVQGAFPYIFIQLPGMMMSPTAYQADPLGFGLNPVGAGAFTVAQYVPDSHLDLVRNPNYWDAPKPYLDGINFRVIPDPTTRAQALVAGDVDVVSNHSLLLASIQGQDGVRDFTLSNVGALGVTPNFSRAPGNDIRIRQAMAYAMDYDLVNDALVLGAWANPGFSCPPFTDALAECVPGVWTYQKDLDRARALVQSYLDDGNTLEGPYSFIASLSESSTGELLQQMLSEIGIDITVDLFDIPEYVARLASGEFDLAMHNIVPFFGPPTSWYRNMQSTQRWIQHGTPNEALDAAIIAARDSLDPQDRLAGAHEVQRINAEELNTIWFMPSIRGLSGRNDVRLGDTYAGGGVFRGQDAWLDR